jgi:hypothetical protein
MIFLYYLFPGLLNDIRGFLSKCVSENFFSRVFEIISANFDTFLRIGKCWQKSNPGDDNKVCVLEKK